MNNSSNGTDKDGLGTKTGFDRFKTAMKAILSVPKEAVTQEEKRQQAEREAARVARRTQRPA